MDGRAREQDLAALIQRKLKVRRHQNYADVVKLIRLHDLDESFQSRLHPSVHSGFIECLNEKRRDDEFEERTDRQLEEMMREDDAEGSFSPSRAVRLMEEPPALPDDEQPEGATIGALAPPIASSLASHLNLFAWQHRLGLAVRAVAFRLPTNRPQRRPDVAFIPYDRWTPQPADEAPVAWEVVPTLIVEEICPNDSITELEEKLRDYFDAGVRIVWVLSPTLRRVYVYQSFTDVRILQETDELDGGSVLPGFRFRIADLFTALTPPSQV